MSHHSDSENRSLIPSPHHFKEVLQSLLLHLVLILYCRPCCRFGCRLTGPGRRFCGTVTWYRCRHRGRCCLIKHPLLLCCVCRMSRFIQSCCKYFLFVKFLLFSIRMNATNATTLQSSFKHVHSIEIALRYAAFELLNATENKTLHGLCLDGARNPSVLALSS